MQGSDPNIQIRPDRWDQAWKTSGAKIRKSHPGLEKNRRRHVAGECGILDNIPTTDGGVTLQQTLLAPAN